MYMAAFLAGTSQPSMAQDDPRAVSLLIELELRGKKRARSSTQDEAIGIKT